MVWKDLVLPIRDHSISFFLLSCPVLVLDIHSGAAGEVSDTEFTKLFGKKFFSFFCVQRPVNTHVLYEFGLLPLYKIYNRSFFFRIFCAHGFQFSMCNHFFIFVCLIFSKLWHVAPVLRLVKLSSWRNCLLLNPFTRLTLPGGISLKTHGHHLPKFTLSPRVDIFNWLPGFILIAYSLLLLFFTSLNLLWIYFQQLFSIFGVDLRMSLLIILTLS